MTDTFEKFNPSGFAVYQRFLAANGKTITMPIEVPVMHSDFEKLSKEAFRAKYGFGAVCSTLEQAHNRIVAHKEQAGARTDRTGLIDWGVSPPRQYAVYEVAATRVE